MIHSQIADMMPGVKNMIEAAEVRLGDQVLLLADRRSDPVSMEAITVRIGTPPSHPDLEEVHFSRTLTSFSE